MERHLRLVPPLPADGPKCKSWVELGDRNQGQILHTSTCVEPADHTGKHRSYVMETPISWANSYRA